MNPAPLLSTFCLSAFFVASAWAQEAREVDGRNRVVVVENVRYDYAQVLNVEPVFQTLRATRTEEHCEPVTTLTLAPVQVKGEEDRSGFRRFWDSVRGIFVAREERPESDGEAPRGHHGSGHAAMLTPECKIVEVGREFRRPIAYDVDYVYKGVKFRSRLPEDPGNRLKLRVSITPDIGSLVEQAAGNP